MAVGGLLNTADGSAYWGQVHMPSTRPWLHVEYEDRPNGGEDFLKSVIFFTHPEHLKAFVALRFITVIQVQVATPGFINGAGVWQFDLIQSIWGVKTSAGESCHDYVLQNGTRYSGCQDDSAEITQRELLFSHSGDQ